MSIEKKYDESIFNSFYSKTELSKYSDIYIDSLLNKCEEECLLIGIETINSNNFNILVINTLSYASDYTPHNCSLNSIYPLVIKNLSLEKLDKKRKMSTCFFYFCLFISSLGVRGFSFNGDNSILLGL